MSRVLLTGLFFILMMSRAAYAQPNPGDAPQLNLVLTVSAGGATYDLNFGLDVRATDGFDTDPGLREDGELPPWGTELEARFERITSDGFQSYRDYRYGNGNDQIVTYYFKIKKDDDDNTNQVTLSWNFPAYATGVLNDANDGGFVSVMNGAGSTTIANNVSGDPIDTFFEMIITYANIPDGLLPVELTAFDALVQDGRALLRWETASETNNAGFEVQQRLGGDFQTIGFVQGRGTTTESQRYTFRTRALAAGRHQFRLKQIDFDGTFAFSGVASADISFAGAAVMDAAHPNPFNPQTQFTLTVAREQEVAIYVYDMLGRQVQTLFRGKLEASAARLFTFEANSLPSGRYFIQAIGQYFTESQTVTLQK